MHKTEKNGVLLDKDEVVFINKIEKLKDNIAEEIKADPLEILKSKMVKKIYLSP